MKKLFSAALAACIALLFTPCTTPFTAAAAPMTFDLSSLAQGIVTVNAPATSSSSPIRKVLVDRGGMKQYYTLPSGWSGGAFPLTRGSGSYQIALYEQVKGSSYRILGSTEVNVKLQNENAVFLQSVQPVAWHDQMAAARTARTLTAKARTDADKMNIIYRYVTTRFKYDFKKANGPLAPAYAPDIDATFRTNKGICYDASALYAAMLRSIGVPVKLVKGYAPNIKVYHAWNEVYLKGRGWYTMDVTTDSAYVQAGRKINKFKNASLYRSDAVI